MPPTGSFSLVLEFTRPVAALIPERLNPAQLRTIGALLPDRATFDDELARRWNCELVLADPDWAHAQKHRTPMLPPKPETIACLQFL